MAEDFQGVWHTDTAAVREAGKRALSIHAYTRTIYNLARPQIKPLRKTSQAPPTSPDVKSPKRAPNPASHEQPAGPDAGLPQSENRPS